MKQYIYIVTIISLTILLSCNSSTQEEKTKYSPIDSNATKQTVELYNQLFSTMEKGIMLGQQDALSYGHGWYGEEGRSDVKDIIDDYPAVIGYDLGHLEKGAEYNLDSVYFSDIRKHIETTHRRGGISTCSWHGDNIVTKGSTWDCKQDYVVKNILPKGEYHEEYLKWLDQLADFFLSLKDDSGNLIPIVFRMYHEHTGNWFWWGNEQCAPEEYKDLWIMTVNYLKDIKKVHNLLYAYSPSDLRDEVHFLERYPGDEYVDIIGFDTYYSANDESADELYKDKLDRNLKIITDYCSTANKLPIIGETGMESVANDHYFTELVYPIINKYKVSWILFWRNAWEPDKTAFHYYMPYKGHPAAENLKEFVENSNILTTKDLATR